ncbi:hypothetical protein EYF80_011235 [Liparis tanakae]|uniref:Uncharacterized protein n=1 Tax=Liparis tanakae TaxID=230148 RepID=A0A4Z2IML9_9TELE|nr:hypothetical protein EYF80_011235 [Liparis tanakae]
MKQSGPGLLRPILERLSLLGVGCERRLGQGTGIEPGGGGLDRSGASLARRTGATCDGMRRCLDRRCSALLYVCLRTVIRIGQSSRIGGRSLACNRLAPERQRPGVARGFRPVGGLATRRPSDVSLSALPLCVAASVRALKVSRAAACPSVRHRRVSSGSVLTLRSGLGSVWRPYLSYGRMRSVVRVVGGVIGRRPSSLRRAAGIRRRPSEEIPGVSIGPPMRLRLRLRLVGLRVGVPLRAVIPVRVCVSSRDESRLILVPCVYVTRIGRPALHSGIRLPRLRPIEWEGVASLTPLTRVRVRVEVDVDGGHLCGVVLLGGLGQPVEADADPRRLPAALVGTRLYDNVWVLLLRVRERVRILSVGVREAPVVDAVAWGRSGVVEESVRVAAPGVLQPGQLQRLWVGAALRRIYVQALGLAGGVRVVEGGVGTLAQIPRAIRSWIRTLNGSGRQMTKGREETAEERWNEKAHDEHDEERDDEEQQQTADHDAHHFPHIQTRGWRKKETQIQEQGRKQQQQQQQQRQRRRAVIISHREVSGLHNSPTIDKSTPCCDVAPRPLSSVENVSRLSTPLSGWADATGCPSRRHEKRAAGSESDRQVRRTVCPTSTSPPPTHSFGESVVSTGVSGPSVEGREVIGRLKKHLIQKDHQGNLSWDVFR